MIFLHLELRSALAPRATGQTRCWPARTLPPALPQLAGISITPNCGAPLNFFFIFFCSEKRRQEESPSLNQVVLNTDIKLSARGCSAQS